MLNTLLALAVALGILFVPNIGQSQEKYGIGTGSVRKALRGGEIEEALAYYEALARESNEKALASGSESDWGIASKVYHLASIAARYAGQLQKAVTYAGINTGRRDSSLRQSTHRPVPTLSRFAYQSPRRAVGGVVESALGKPNRRRTRAVHRNVITSHRL